MAYNNLPDETGLRSGAPWTERPVEDRPDDAFGEPEPYLAPREGLGVAGILGMSASAAAVTTGALFGLRSFSGTGIGEIFGPIGEAFHDPAGALHKMLQSRTDLYRSQGGATQLAWARLAGEAAGRFGKGAGHSTREAGESLKDAAERNDRSLRLAKRHQFGERGRLRSISQGMVKAKTGASFARTTKEIRDDAGRLSRAVTRFRRRKTEERLGGMLSEGLDGTSGFEEGSMSASGKERVMQNPLFQELATIDVNKTAEATRDQSRYIGRLNTLGAAQRRLAPDLLSEPDSPYGHARRAVLGLMSQSEEYAFRPGGSDQHIGKVASGQSALGQHMQTLSSGEARGPHSLTSALGGLQDASRFLSSHGESVDEDLDQAARNAWASFRQANRGEWLDPDRAPEEIFREAQVRPGLGRELSKELSADPEPRGTLTQNRVSKDTDHLFDLDRPGSGILGDPYERNAGGEIPFAIQGKHGGRNVPINLASTFAGSGSGEMYERARSRIEEAQRAVKAQVSEDVNVELKLGEAESMRGRFRGHKFVAQIGEERFEHWVPLPDQRGLYLPSPDSRPVVSKTSVERGTGIMSGRGAGQIISGEGGAAPMHLQELRGLGNIAEKLKNDIIDEQQSVESGASLSGRLAGQIGRVHDKAFRNASTAPGSAQDALNKALTMESAEAKLYERFETDYQLQEEKRDALRQVERAQRTWNEGGAIHAADTEHAEMGGEAERGFARGEQRGQAKTPYEFGGSVFRKGAGGASEPQHLMQYRFVPNLLSEDLSRREGLTEAQQGLFDDLNEQIRAFQSGAAGKSEEGVDRMIRDLQQGVFEFTGPEGNTFDWTDVKEGNLPGWAPSYRTGEDRTAYFKRFMRKTGKEFQVRGTTAHAFAYSEEGIYKGFFGDDNVPRFLRGEQAFDTYAMVQAADPTATESLSLTSLSAKGAEDWLRRNNPNIDEGFALEMNAFDDVLSRTQKAVERGGNAIQQVRGAFPEGSWQQHLGLKVAQITGASSSGTHSALFDARIAEQFAMPALFDYYGTAEGRQTLQMQHDLLNFQQKPTGRRQFAEKWGMKFGDYNDQGEFEGGFNPYFPGPEAASYGAASGVPMGALGFGPLQNPARQLYQRFKANPQVNRTNVGWDAQNPTDMPFAERTRGGVLAEQRLGHQPLTTFVDPNKIDPRTGRAATSQARAPHVRGMMMLNPTQRKELTQSGMGRWGQGAGISLYGAALPVDHPLAWESQLSMTAGAAEDLRSTYEVRETSTEIRDSSIFDSITEAQGNRREVNSARIDQMAGQMGADPSNRVTREHLRQVALLERLRDQAGFSEQGLKILERSIMQRRRLAERGQHPTFQALADQAVRRMRRTREGNIGGKMALASGGVLEGPLESISNPEVAGIRMRVTQDAGGKFSLTLQQAENTGSTVKTMVNQSSKVGGARTSTGSALGLYGEQIGFELAGAKPKRKEMSGMIQSYMGRLYGQSALELSAARREGRLGTSREGTKNRLARSLSELSGLSETKVKEEIIAEGEADLFRLTPTSEFERGVEEASLPQFESAAKESGLTVRSVVERGRAKNISRKDTLGILSTDIENVADALEEKAGEWEKNGKHPEKVGSYRKNAEDYKRLATRMAEAAEGSEAAYSEVGGRGSLFDVTKMEDGRLTTAFLGIQTAVEMQLPVTGAQSMETQFEASTGRPTKSGRSKSFTASLMSRAMGFGPSGPRSAEGLLFEGYMASESGVGSISTRHTREEIARALQQKGLFRKSKLFREGQFRGTVSQGENGGVVVTPEGEEDPINLRIAPYSALRSHTRSRTLMLGMIHGSIEADQVGGAAAVGDVISIGDDLSMETFASRYGSKAQAAKRRRIQGLDPAPGATDDSNSLYFGPDETPGYGNQSSIFDPRYGAIKVDLFGGVSGQRLGELRKLAGEAGVSRSTIGKTLGGQPLLETVLRDAESPAERRRMKAMLSGMDSEARSLFVPTLTGDNRPELRTMDQGPGYQVSAPSIRKLAEARGSVREHAEMVQRIRDRAEGLMPGRAGDARQLGDIIREEVNRPETSAATEQTAGLFRSGFKQLVLQGASAMEDMSGRYFAGEFKVATTLRKAIPDFKEMARRVGSESDFRDFVRERVQTSDMEIGKEVLPDVVKEVHEDLFGYVKEQTRMARQKGWDPTDVHKWRGFGVSEGILSRDRMEPVVDELKGRLREYQRNPEMVEEMGRALREAGWEGDPSSLLKNAEGYVDMIDQELKSPGSTSGALNFFAKEPMFSSPGEMDARGVNMLASESLRAVGLDPQQTNSMVGPIDSERFMADFDFDQAFTFGMKDPVAAAVMNEGSRKQGARDAMRQYMMLTEPERFAEEGFRPSEGTVERMARVGSVNAFESVTDSGRNRVVLPDALGDDGGMSQENITDTGSAFGRFFGARGSARDLQSSGLAARQQYGMQQALAGQLGREAKQSAVRLGQISGGLEDVMSRFLVGLESRSSAEVQKLKKSMSGMGPMVSKGGREFRDPLEFLKQTMIDLEETRRGPGANELAMYGRMEGQVSEIAGIMKYEERSMSRQYSDWLASIKGEGPMSPSRAIQDFVDHDFSDRGDRLWSFFIDPDKDAGRGVDHMKQATRRRFERGSRMAAAVMQSTKILDQMGLGTEYLARSSSGSAANLSTFEQTLEVMGPGARQAYGGVQRPTAGLEAAARAMNGMGPIGENEIRARADNLFRMARTHARWGQASRPSKSVFNQLGDVFDSPTGKTAAAGLIALPVLGLMAGGGGPDYERREYTRNRNPAQALELRQRREAEATWAKRSRSAPMGVFAGQERPYHRTSH